MTLRRGVLCAIFIYVTLDLSLPMMPGAFVFEPAESVESAQRQRGREAVEVLVIRAPVRGPVVLAQPWIDVPNRAAPPGEVAFLEQPMVNWLPRSILEPAAASEEPH